MLRLSFIVPFYNVEPYIEECIRSLYAQDIPQSEYEVICVDDCSPDGSRAIVERLQNEYPTLKLLVHAENKRQGGARNTGLKEAKGRYIWFVDSDDVVMANTLQTLLLIAESHELNILQFDYTRDFNKRSNSKIVIGEIRHGEAYLFGDALFDWVDALNGPWRQLIERKFLIDNNLRFIEGEQYEDTDYLIKIFLKAERVQHVSLIAYRYRENADSTTLTCLTPTNLAWQVNQYVRITKLVEQTRMPESRKKLIKMIGLSLTELRKYIKNYNYADRRIYRKTTSKELRLCRPYVKWRTWFAIRYGITWFLETNKNNLTKRLHETRTIIRRKWRTLRLRPIMVLCVHHISDAYNPFTMWECDWMQTEVFKQNIRHIQKCGYRFISLADAHEKLKRDRFRFHKYAVLTADDGYKSILNILPWLEERQIPITLFVNTKYLDGKSWSTTNEEQARRAKPDVDMLKEVCPDLYLSKEKLFSLTSPLISIGLHGHEHLNATKQTIAEFKDNVGKCQSALQHHPRYIPFFAYPWGGHNHETDELLNEMHLVPVISEDEMNFDNTEYIDRMPIERAVFEFCG